MLSSLLPTLVVALALSTTTGGSIAATSSLPSSSPDHLRWPSVAGPLPRQGDGANDVAVIVGVADYLVLPDIAGADDNARDWAQHLIRVRGLSPSKVVVLTDAEATRERIERALRQATAQATPTSRLWFLFVGHGAPSSTGRDGLLLGADAQPDADSLSARGLPQAVVEEIVGSGQQREAIVVYDACFSGRTSDGGAPLVQGLQATLPVRKAPPPTPKPMTVLASSESFAGPLPGEARPAFSYLLLGGLRGWADEDGDGAITVDDAWRFASTTLSTALKQSTRAPVRRGAQSALRVKVGEEAPDVSALLLQRCPEGTRWEGRRCAVVDCPKGTRFDGERCAATALSVQCPPGSTWNGSACAVTSTTVSCPPGTGWNGSACAASTVECPPGADWNGHACASQVSSPSPSPSTVRCPPGTHARDGACVFDDDDDAMPGPGASPGTAAPTPQLTPEQQAHVERLNQLQKAGYFRTDEKRGAIVFSTDLLFQRDQLSFTDQGGFALGATIGQILVVGGVGADVLCHTDNTGARAGRLVESQLRATAIGNSMRQAGVKVGSTLGVGPDQPAYDNRTNAGRTLNRRCEVLVRKLR